MKYREVPNLHFTHKCLKEWHFTLAKSTLFKHGLNSALYGTKY